MFYVLQKVQLVSDLCSGVGIDSLNDYENFTGLKSCRTVTNFPPGAKNLIRFTPLQIGGVSDIFSNRIKSGPFHGCISNLRINGEVRLYFVISVSLISSHWCSANIPNPLEL